MDRHFCLSRSSPDRQKCLSHHHTETDPVRRPLSPLLLLLAGCGGPAVPRQDRSAAPAYTAQPFKDDAPSQAAPADFPTDYVDADGKPVDLTEYRGRPVVLVVLRGLPREYGGGFCPSCLAQAGSLMANRAAFDARKAAVLVVFPGPADRLGEFVQTARQAVPGEPPLAFPLLLDRDARACVRLGITADLAKPSTYVLDAAGRVVYAYVGETSTDRPSVKAVLARLDRLPPP